METKRNYTNIARRIIGLENDGQNLQHFMSDSPLIKTRILRRRISEGKALLENSPFLPQKRAVLGDFSSVLNQNRHFLTCF
jgi:hypothetical protein